MSVSSHASMLNHRKGCCLAKKRALARQFRLLLCSVLSFAKGFSYWQDEITSA